MKTEAEAEVALALALAWRTSGDNSAVTSIMSIGWLSSRTRDLIDNTSIQFAAACKEAPKARKKPALLSGWWIT